MVSKYAFARFFGCLLALVVHATSATALDTTSDVLTPATAAEEALRTNPDLRAAYAVIEIARGRLVQAGLWPNPELSLSGVDDFAFQNEGERGASVGLAQRFPIARRLARARDVARVDVAR